jgi:hypothetical protein
MSADKVPEIKPGTLIKLKHKFYFEEKVLLAGEIVMYIKTGPLKHPKLKASLHTFLAANGQKLTYWTTINFDMFVLYNVEHQNFEVLT